MAILSKLLLLDYTMSFNCYELGHTWTPFCSRAAIDMGSATFIESVKMYTALYTFNQLISRKFDSQSTLNTLRSIVQSSTFLAFNAYSVLMIFCGSRQFMGKFYYLFAAHLPAIIGSYLSILLERKSRRSALSFYVANIASETMWNKLVATGYLKPLPAGETILFALSTASFLYLIHSQGRYGKDPVSFAFNFLLGSDFMQHSDKCSSTSLYSVAEEASEKFTQDNAESDGQVMLKHHTQPQATSEENADHHLQHQHQVNSRLGHSQLTHHHHHHHTTTTHSQGNCDGAQGETLSSAPLVVRLLSSPSIVTDSCLLNVVHSFIRSGLIAYLGNSLVTLSLKPQNLSSKPIDTITRALLYNENSRKLALFASCFTGIFKGCNCINSYLMQSQGASNSSSSRTLNGSPVATFFTALLASSSMLVYRSPRMAQYMLWKLLETLYFRSVKAGTVKHVDFTLNMLYAVSTAHLFYVAVMEPKMISKSYTRWLNKVTGGCFALLNRNIMDVFGTESSFGYPIYYPEIDVLEPQYVSDKFKESVLVWML